jgi:hypothetical protein
MQAERKARRSLPCRFLSVACREHCFDRARFSSLLSRGFAGLAAAGGDVGGAAGEAAGAAVSAGAAGVCAKAAAVATSETSTDTVIDDAMINDFMTPSRVC